MATEENKTCDPALAKLFGEVEAKIRGTGLGEDKWFIITLASMVAGPDPERASDLYLYLCSQPQYASSPARQGLVRRLREVLVKAIAIVGVCKPIEAVLSIAAVERPEDRDYSATRPGWQCDEANHQRALDWFHQIYSREKDTQVDLFAAHRDFAWISHEITYGFYLGDRQVLGDLDTELVVLPAIQSQNLPTETHWHIRGLRRIGVPLPDVEVVVAAVHAIAAHSGVKLHKVPEPKDVEYDV